VCEQEYVYDHTKAGQQFKCRWCGQLIVMPPFESLSPGDQSFYRTELQKQQEKAERKQRRAAERAETKRRRASEKYAIKVQKRQQEELELRQQAQKQRQYAEALKQAKSEPDKPKVWLCSIDGTEYGPMQESIVQNWIDEGKLDQGDHVRVKGSPVWLCLSDIPERFQFGRRQQEEVQATRGNDTLRLTFGLIGTLLLFCGVFAPFMRLPIVGGVDYFRGGEGDGVIVLILAIVSLISVIIRQYKVLWFTGVGSACVIGFIFGNLMTRVQQAKDDMARDLADNPFAPLGEALVESVSIDWGFPVLVVGAGLVIAAAAIRSRDQVARSTLVPQRGPQSVKGSILRYAVPAGVGFVVMVAVIGTWFALHTPAYFSEEQITCWAKAVANLDYEIRFQALTGQRTCGLKTVAVAKSRGPH
jgi:hypothetical protein